MWNFARIRWDVWGPMPKKVSSAACRWMFLLEEFDMRPGRPGLATVKNRKSYLYEAVLREINAEYEDLVESVTLLLIKGIEEITIVKDVQLSPLHRLNRINSRTVKDQMHVGRPSRAVSAGQARSLKHHQEATFRPALNSLNSLLISQISPSTI